jgi:hypothetical protein
VRVAFADVTARIGVRVFMRPFVVALRIDRAKASESACATQWQFVPPPEAFSWSDFRDCLFGGTC